MEQMISKRLKDLKDEQDCNIRHLEFLNTQLEMITNGIKEYTTLRDMYAGGIQTLDKILVELENGKANINQGNEEYEIVDKDEADFGSTDA